VRTTSYVIFQEILPAWKFYGNFHWNIYEKFYGWP